MNLAASIFSPIFAAYSSSKQYGTKSAAIDPRRFVVVAFALIA
jgi:hypothetical protein